MISRCEPTVAFCDVESDPRRRAIEFTADLLCEPSLRRQLVEPGHELKCHLVDIETFVVEEHLRCAGACADSVVRFVFLDLGLSGSAQRDEHLHNRGQPLFSTAHSFSRDQPVYVSNVDACRAFEGRSECDIELRCSCS